MEERVPEIRFKGFEGPWEKRKLSDLATMHARIGWQNLRTSEFLDRGDYMLVTGTDFDNGKINYSTCHYVEQERYEQDRNIQIKNGNILITKDGTLGKVAFVQDLSMPATLNAGVFNVEIKDETLVSNKYLFQYLKAPFLLEYVEKKATGGTIKHLNQNLLVDFPILVPTKEEQESIGTYFNGLDNLITLTQQKLDQLNIFKKACLEKMFPKEGETVPEVRFQGFEGPWEKIIFEEFVKRSSEQSADASLPRVEYEDIVSGIGTINKDLYQKNSHKSGIIFHKGDVLYGKLRPYLQNWLLAFFDGIAVGDFWVLQPQGIDSGFLYRLIQGRKFSDTANQSTGTKMPRADWKLVSKTAFFIPQNVNEQFVIGDFFMNLDSLIISSEQKLGQLKTLKKALLDKMFV